jgi:hypothetical protein
MQEINASRPQPSPLKPVVPHAITPAPHAATPASHTTNFARHTMTATPPASASPTTASFTTAVSTLREDADDADRPLSAVRRTLALQFPLPPSSPLSATAPPLPEKRRKRLSASVVAELQRALGTDLALSDADSPHLPYAESPAPPHAEAPGPPPARCLPRIPLPPPPHASKRHAVSLQLPPAARARAHRKASLAFPSREAREAREVHVPEAHPAEAQLRAERARADALARELQAARTERVALLARIAALERRCERVAFAVHGRAESAGSVYSAESVAAVASELAGAGFLPPPSPARYRRSVLGVPDEHRARVSDEERRRSSPVLLGGHFGVLDAADPLAALEAAGSLPSLSSASTLSSLAESPVLPHLPDVRVYRAKEALEREALPDGQWAVRV